LSPVCSSFIGLSRLGCLALSELKWAYEIVGGVSPLQGRRQKHKKCGYTYMSMVGLKCVIIVRGSFDCMATVAVPNSMSQIVLILLCFCTQH